MRALEFILGLWLVSWVQTTGPALADLEAGVGGGRGSAQVSRVSPLNIFRLVANGGKTGPASDRSTHFLKQTVSILQPFKNILRNNKELKACRKKD